MPLCRAILLEVLMNGAVMLQEMYRRRGFCKALMACQGAPSAGVDGVGNASGTEGKMHHMFGDGTGLAVGTSPAVPGTSSAPVLGCSVVTETQAGIALALSGQLEAGLQDASPSTDDQHPTPPVEPGALDGEDGYEHQGVAEDVGVAEVEQDDLDDSSASCSISRKASSNCTDRSNSVCLEPDSPHSSKIQIPVPDASQDLIRVYAECLRKVQQQNLSIAKGPGGQACGPEQADGLCASTQASDTPSMAAINRTRLANRSYVSPLQRLWVSLY